MRDFRVLTPDRVGDLSGPCTPCSFWQTVPHNGHAVEPDPLVLLKNWVEEVTEDWGPPGRVVYVDDVPSGYVLLAPARHVPRLAAFPTSPSDPSTLILLTTCAGPSDPKGLRKALVQTAAKDALRHKARSIDAIGARAQAVRRHPCVLEVDFLERSGFRVEREHPAYPRMRLDLRTVLSLKDEVAGVAARALARVPRLRPAEAPHPDGATRARTRG
jgi:hypothetical protein